MISVLVVEDTPAKIGLIREVLTSNGISETNIYCASCIIEAKRLLSGNKYDVMLLDVMLPLRQGDDPIENGGLNLLSDVSADEKYIMPDHIIGITAYQDVCDTLGIEFSNRLINLLKYDPSEEEWKERIGTLIRQVTQAAERGQGIVPNYNYDLAIICAKFSPELEQILRLPFLWEPYSILTDCTSYYAGKANLNGTDVKIICAVACEMGMAASAILTSKIITFFRPKVIVMTGISAGVKREDENYGDILLADPSFDYGSGKVVIENGHAVFKPDYRQLRVDPDIIKIFEILSRDSTLLNQIREQCNAAKPTSILKIHIGALGSGASVIANKELVENIKSHNRSLIGIDMEAYGVMLAVHQAPKPQPKAFCIKSISDFADEVKDDRYHSYASFTSAAILKEFIRLYFKV